MEELHDACTMSSTLRPDLALYSERGIYKRRLLQRGVCTRIKLQMLYRNYPK